MTASILARFGAIALLLVLFGCNGIDFGGKPGHEFPKETGPLTVPPAGVRNGTAR